MQVSHQKDVEYSSTYLFVTLRAGFSTRAATPVAPLEALLSGLSTAAATAVALIEALVSGLRSGANAVVASIGVM